MGTKLTTTEARAKANCCEIVDQHIGGFMAVGRALTQLREEELFLDEADSFREFIKKRWPQHLSYAYRQISSFEAAIDVSEVPVSPIGDKDKTSLPKNEAIAREIAKVESPEQRATLWAASHKGRQEKDVTAAHVAKKRRDLFPEPQSDTVTVEPIEAIKSWIKKIDAIRRDIDDVQPLYKTESKEWQTALDELDEGRKALARLVK